MKRILKTLPLLFLCISPSWLRADALLDGINLTSEQYDASLQWTEKQSSILLLYPNETSSSASYSSSGPFSVSAHTPNAPDSGTVSFNRFSLHESSADGGENIVSGSDYSIMYEGRMQTHGQAVWNFTPLNQTLSLGLNIGAYYSKYGTASGGLTVRLVDLTTSTTLLNLQSPVNYTSDGYAYFGQDNYNFDVNPADQYQFLLSAFSDSFSYDSTSIDIDATFGSPATPLVSTVPDEASTLGLFVGALIGLALIGHSKLNLRVRARDCIL